MNTIKFYKLTLELNSKINIAGLNLLERVSDVVAAKNSFNVSLEGKKLVVLLSITKNTVNLILRIDNSQSLKINLKTIQRFVNILHEDYNWKTLFSKNSKGFFKLSSIKPMDEKACRTVINAIYSDGYEYIESIDIKKLFEDTGEEKSDTSEDAEKPMDIDEENTNSLEDALAKVDSLIGLSAFKSEVKSLVKFIDTAKAYGVNETLFPCHYILNGMKGVSHISSAKLLKEVFFHLGLIKNRKLLSINVPESSNQYSGLSFEDFVEDDTGAIFLEEIFDCEDNISLKKVLDNIAAKMEQTRGKVLVIISQYNKKDSTKNIKKLQKALESRVNTRIIDMAYPDDTELGLIVHEKAVQRGLKLSHDSIEEIACKIKSSESISLIENEVEKIIDKAYLSKVFSLVSDNKTEKVSKLHKELLGQSKVSANLCLETSDFNFLSTPSTIEEIPEDYIDNSLSQMIGLNEVKNRIQQLYDLLTVRGKKQELGIASKAICLHMQFVGNPGTGKTTVARIVGKILKNLGFLSKGHFVEVTRNDLIGEYIGQTTPKIKKVIDKSKGGILFIDEAYSLCQANDNDYGFEAVSELVKAMEDLKDDLVIIFAGYPKEMKKMIAMNPGLKDRIGFTIEFPDYSHKELFEILLIMCKDNNYNLENEASGRLYDIIGELVTRKDENFGNARIIRKFFERLEIIQNSRICTKHSFQKDEITKVTYEDVLNLYTDCEIKKLLKHNENAKMIGFKNV